MIQWWITSGIVGIFLGSICFKDCTGICHAPLRSRTQRDYPPDGFESTSGYPRRSLFRDHRLWWVTSLSVRLLDWSTAGIYLIVFAEHMSVLYKRNVNKRQSAYYLIGTSLALIGLITAVCALHYTYLFFLTGTVLLACHRWSCTDGGRLFGRYVHSWCPSGVFWSDQDAWTTRGRYICRSNLSGRCIPGLSLFHRQNEIPNIHRFSITGLPLFRGLGK